MSDASFGLSKFNSAKELELMAKHLVPDKILPFGDLQVVEVYSYYDGPRLFSLYSKSKDLYLIAIAVDENEESGDLTFLYLPLLPKDFEAVSNNKRDLHDTFKFSKGGTVWIVTSAYSDSPLAEERAVNGIPKEWLPSPEAFLGESIPELE